MQLIKLLLLFLYPIWISLWCKKKKGGGCESLVCLEICCDNFILVDLVHRWILLYNIQYISMDLKIWPNQIAPVLFHGSLFNSDSVEFINGMDTDKANTYVEDCIGKMEPLDKVWS